MIFLQLKSTVQWICGKSRPRTSSVGMWANSRSLLVAMLTLMLSSWGSRERPSLSTFIFTTILDLPLGVHSQSRMLARMRCVYQENNSSLSTCDIIHLPLDTSTIDNSIIRVTKPRCWHIDSSAPGTVRCRWLENQSCTPRLTNFWICCTTERSHRFSWQTHSSRTALMISVRFVSFMSGTHPWDLTCSS